MDNVEITSENLNAVTISEAEQEQQIKQELLTVKGEEKKSNIVNNMEPSEGDVPNLDIENTNTNGIIETNVNQQNVEECVNIEKEKENEKEETELQNNIEEPKLNKVDTNENSNCGVLEFTEISADEPITCDENLDASTTSAENEENGVTADNDFDLFVEDVQSNPEVEMPMSEDVNNQTKKSEEIVEITEISTKDDNASASDNSFEYTVIEEPNEADLTTEEIVEQSPEETLLLIGYDGNESVSLTDEGNSVDKNSTTDEYIEYIIGQEQETAEEVDEPEPTTEEEPKVQKSKKPRGRKPIADIPLHVLGRDITKPTEGVTNGGRTMPKPRLGVKVPYKNLTSQMVTKEDIQKEIMDRFKQKQEQNPRSATDILFARKLTQRLARKLIPTESSSKTDTEEISVAKSPSRTDDENKSEVKAATTNNSDLIAILEGNDEETDKLSNFEKEKEKEIALQQLKELPGTTPVTKNRIFKSRTTTSTTTTSVTIMPISSLAITTITATTTTATATATTENPKSNPNTSSNVNNNPKIHSKEQCADNKQTSIKNEKNDTQMNNAAEKKMQVDVMPQLNAEMVIKTYARKRRSMESEIPLPPKKSLISTNISSTAVTNSSTSIATTSPTVTEHVYVTKSSRVIKKKVIWDPDDKSPKSTNKITKSTESSSTKQQQHLEKSPVNIEQIENKSPSSSKKSPSKSNVNLNKNKRRLTEVDRLLMDEGAVNMMYDINNTENANQDKLKKKTKSIISLDKAHMELMSKTNVIKNDLQQNANKQKSLRKKDSPSSSTTTPVSSPTKKSNSPSTTTAVSSGTTTTPSPGTVNNTTNIKKEVMPTPISRKKSKDSSRSSLHSPPASPAFAHAADASRIIRRHSSSSFSSGDEVQHGEQNNDETKITNERITRKKSHSLTIAATESPPKKKTRKNLTKQQQTDKFKIYETFNVTKTDKLISIEINNKNDYYLNAKALKELTNCLIDLSTDDDCNIVCLTSDDDKVFCRGLNYKELLSDNANERKHKATELSSCLKDFLKCLLNFPKILLVGIQGNCNGLGVTMLPLFDIVIASDISTFSTIYAKLGCMAEAGFLLNPPYLNSNGLASELLFTSQILKADDAFRRGLITKLCWPEKYNEEFNEILTNLKSGSVQSLQATKKHMRQINLKNVEIALDSETDTLIEHWISSLCQTNFSKIECI